MGNDNKLHPLIKVTIVQDGILPVGISSQWTIVLGILSRGYDPGSVYKVFPPYFCHKWTVEQNLSQVRPRLFALYSTSVIGASNSWMECTKKDLVDYL